MSTKPIIFSDPMVRALLEGRKTQTRRVLKLPANMHQPARDDTPDVLAPLAPYAPGDLLWVRETWVPTTDGRNVVFRADNRDLRGDAWTSIAADPKDVRWKPSIHMPRWASRLTLEVTDVRVQRVQEISDFDVLDEGVPMQGGAVRVRDDGRADVNAQWRNGAFLEFIKLWDSFNAKRGYGWDANPWVVALTFAVHRQNVDELLRQREAA